MKNHANKVLELYGKSRGKGSEYWGEKLLENDMHIHTLGFEQLADEWELQQDPEVKVIYSNFVDRMNSYLENHPDQIEEKNKMANVVITAKGTKEAERIFKNLSQLKRINDKGLSKSIKAGYLISKGEYVVVMDTDGQHEIPTTNNLLN